MVLDHELFMFQKALARITLRHEHHHNTIKKSACFLSDAPRVRLSEKDHSTLTE